MFLAAQFAVKERLSLSSKESPIATDVDNLVRLMRIFECNNFSVTNDRLEVLGSACVPLSGLTNHSCLPNCMYTWEVNAHTQTLEHVCRCIEDLHQVRLLAL